MGCNYMPITREQFEQIREELGAHTSWALWTPQGVKAIPRGRWFLWKHEFSRGLNTI